MKHRKSKLKRRYGHSKKRELSVFDKHQLKIARDSLRMPDAMLGVMGGPSKEEAREIIRRLTGKEAPEYGYAHGPIGIQPGETLAAAMLRLGQRRPDETVKQAFDRMDLAEQLRLEKKWGVSGPPSRWGHAESQYVMGKWWDRKTGTVKEGLGTWVRRPDGKIDYFVPKGRSTTWKWPK